MVRKPLSTNHTSTGDQSGDSISVAETSSAPSAPSSSTRSPLLGWFGTVSLLTLLSRVLGLLRDIATASLFGLGGVMDAFAVAFRIPNLSRRLFGEGALAAAFLPVFSATLHQRGATAAWQLGSTLFAILALILVLLVLVGEGICYVLWLALGSGAQTELLLGLTATLLPYLIVVCLSAQVAAMLQTLGHFTLPALAPALTNVGWLIAVWIVAPQVSAEARTQAYVLAVGIVASVYMTLMLQMRALRSYGFRFQINWQASRETLLAVVRGLGPMLLGLAVIQINAFSDSLMAWLLAQPENGAGTFTLLGQTIPYPMRGGAAASLYFAERLYQFPLGVFGVALGTAIYPLLARHASHGDQTALCHDLALGLKWSVVIGLPAGAGLMILAQPIVEAAFRYGSFDAADALRAARTVVGYSAGIWAYCALQILVRGFYALGDRITPVKVGSSIVGLNLALNLILIWPLAEVGLALATAVSAMIYTAVLVSRLPQKRGFPWKELAHTAGQSLAATALMSIVVAGAFFLFPAFGTISGRLFRVAVLIMAGLGAYALLAWKLGLIRELLTARNEAGRQDPTVDE